MADATMFTVMPLSELSELIKKSVRESFNNELREFIKGSVREEEPLLQIEDACQLLKVSKVTIHKWKKQNKIRYYRIGRKIYFKRSELISSLNFLNQKKISNGGHNNFKGAQTQ